MNGTETVVLILILLFLAYRVMSWLSSSPSEEPRQGASAAEMLGLYFGPLEIRFARRPENTSLWTSPCIEFRGAFPVTQPQQINISTHIEDVTDGAPVPVVGLVREFQGEGGIYHVQLKGKMVRPGESIVKWAPIAPIERELMLPPRAGRRKLRATLLVYPSSSAIQVPAYSRSEVLASATVEFNLGFEDGYEEQYEKQAQSRVLTIKIAVAVALADEALVDEEGETIRLWMQQNLEAYAGAQREEMRKSFNDALTSSYAEAKAGTLALSDLCQQLRKVGDRKSKYDTIELCRNVMTADEHVDPREVAVIRQVAEGIDFDLNKLQEMMDTLRLDSPELFSQDPEAAVGIDPSWPTERKCKHLTDEFRKWNGRMGSLSAGPEREAAQEMLDLIAELRKKYQC